MSHQAPSYPAPFGSHSHQKVEVKCQGDASSSRVAVSWKWMWKLTGGSIGAQVIQLDGRCIGSFPMLDLIGTDFFFFFFPFFFFGGHEIVVVVLVVLSLWSLLNSKCTLLRLPADCRNLTLERLLIIEIWCCDLYVSTARFGYSPLCFAHSASISLATSPSSRPPAAKRVWRKYGCVEGYMCEMHKH